MKNFTQFLVFMCVATFTLSCDKVKEQYDAISKVETTSGTIILDVTDEDLANISGEKVFDYCNRAIPESGDIRFTIISRKRTNKEASIYKKAPSLTDKAMLAKDTLEAYNKKYEEDFNRIFSDFNHPIPNCKESYVFSTVKEELDRLANSKSDKRFLICFSDAIENSSGYSFYWDKRRPEAIVENQQKILNKLEKAFGKLPENLSGIKVVFVHEPNYRMDKLFSATKDWWKMTLESRGADVHFQTSLY